MVQYAGFWKRFVAWIIDMVATQVVISAVSLVTGGIGGGLLGLVGGWLYFALMESSSKQATLGKMALGIIVTDYNGNRISFARATGRHFAKIISAILLLVGYIMIAFTEKKQGLHDIISGCLVVRAKGDSHEEYLDALCPRCGQPVSSRWKECIHCQKQLTEVLARKRK
ncbi:MAG: RDD family protein [Candidatus Thorarchaeota archaeon]